MTVKNYKQNTNFQIAYFLAGSCHTPDGAYAMLCNLRDERTAAIQNYDVAMLRNKAKKLKAEEQPNDFECQADILEINNSEISGKVLLEAALDELSFIQKCIDAVNPHRKYKDLPDIKAHEAAQQEEWKLELINRAENYLLTVGNIPADQFTTMRMHPEFITEILPAINNVVALLNSPEKNHALLATKSSRFNLPLLLENLK
jgi:hypothetical protein